MPQVMLMKPTTLIGMLLVVLGVLALLYQGFTYTREKEVFDIGPVRATTEEHERIAIPPLVGGLTLAGGLVLLVGSLRRSH